ncbi:MAG: helix-turn-helix domain-containing protein [Candidatus Moraniibacteriota bacterium]
MNEDLVPLIESIGLKNKDAKIYLALLELGNASASQIAKVAKIKRPTTYLILEELKKNGFVSQSAGNKTKKYQAISPEIILAKKKTDLKNFAEMIPFLQTLQNKSGMRPKISYFTDNEGILNVYEDLNYAKEAFYISSYQKINEHFGHKLAQWTKNYEKNFYKVDAKHLVPNTEAELPFAQQFAKAGQKVRLLPKEKRFDTDLVLTENKLSISSLTDEQPFLVLIESKQLADSLRPIFEIIWEASQELE